MRTRSHLRYFRPNTPCPCGSGRKYKRCCGAN
ncbi:MAG: SEC-C domain-containing protein [Acetobacteraceae bacterium]|nr:SEC-C domain-containing protein [Acetobacteraceae bacterium]